MSCYRPLPAARARSGGPVVVGRWSGTDGMDSLELPCGKCEGCLMDRANAWALRCGHEAQHYLASSFITLTYDDEHLPRTSDGLPTLFYRDVQLFLKKLRHFSPVRFFCAGEYGTENSRPHYHLLLFGVWLSDFRPFNNGTFRSDTLLKLWEHGDREGGGPVIGTVTPQSVAYTSQYCMKKVYGRAARGHYGGRVAEFIQMSRNPGIGSDWFKRYGKDLFPADRAVRDGAIQKVPRYYWERFILEAHPNLIEDIRDSRVERAVAHLAESTPERRAVREEVHLRRRQFFSRREL